jgi:RNA recognition motif-containing protein
MSEEKKETTNAEQQPVDKTLKRIWIGNLPTNTNRAELEDLCLSCGKVIKIDYRDNGTFGFVTFQSHEDADFAIYKINGRNFRNQVLKARWSDKETKKPEKKEGQAQGQRQGGPRGEREKKRKEKKPMMSLTHLTPRNEPSRAGANAQANATPFTDWKSNQNAQLVQQSGHSHNLDHTQNQSHNHALNQQPSQNNNHAQNFSQNPANQKHNNNQNQNYNQHHRNHYPNNNNQNNQGWGQ